MQAHKEEEKPSSTTIMVQKSAVNVIRVVASTSDATRAPNFIAVVKSSAITNPITAPPIAMPSQYHREPIVVYNENFDPRQTRIDSVEQPILESYGFQPFKKDRWRGEINRVPIEVELTPSFPIDPPNLWLYNGVPKHFHHVIPTDDGRVKVCFEKLIYIDAWTPQTTIDTIFTNLEKEREFRPPLESRSW